MSVKYSTHNLLVNKWQGLEKMKFEDMAKTREEIMDKIRNESLAD